LVELSFLRPSGRVTARTYFLGAFVKFRKATISFVMSALTRKASYPQTHALESVATGIGKYASEIKQCLDRPLGLQEVEAPIIPKNSRQMKMARLSALSNGRIYPMKIPLVLISVIG